MTQEISNHLANGLAATAGASATATGLMGFFSYYAAGIGAIFTVLTFVTWVFFQLRHDKKLSLADTNQDEISKLKTQINAVNKGISEILSKLDKQG